MNTLTRDIALGAAGGILGTLAMGKVTSFLYKFESEEKKKREEEIRPKAPPVMMIEKIDKNILGDKLSKKATKKVGMGVHWGYGIAWGAVYAVARRKYPALSKAGGLPFAFLFALVGDEIMNTVFKITPPPQKFPWEAHARGFAGHAAFTAVNERMLKVSDKKEAEKKAA